MPIRALPRSLRLARRPTPLPIVPVIVLEVLISFLFTVVALRWVSAMRRKKTIQRFNKDLAADPGLAARLAYARAWYFRRARYG